MDQTPPLDPPSLSRGLDRSFRLTEPDPREDLSGADVRRKLLILARETGLPLEPNDISVENILPHACLAVRTVEEFFAELEKHDTHFEALRQEAEQQARRHRHSVAETVGPRKDQAQPASRRSSMARATSASPAGSTGRS